MQIADILPICCITLLEWQSFRQCNLKQCFSFASEQKWKWRVNNQLQTKQLKYCENQIELCVYHVVWKFVERIVKYLLSTFQCMEILFS